MGGACLCHRIHGFGVLHTLASGTGFLVLFSLRFVFNFFRCLLFLVRSVRGHVVTFDMDGSDRFIMGARFIPSYMLIRMVRSWYFVYRQ